MKKFSLTTAILSMIIGLSVHAEAIQSKREEFHKALDVCFTETGVTKPARGERPNDEDRQKVDSCLASKGFDKEDRPLRRKHSEEEKAAFKECISELNLPTPQKGVRPSKEDHEKVHACLKAKGLDIPARD